MGSISVGAIQTQLRRLTNQSSCLNDAAITYIPSNRSNVSFVFEEDEGYCHAVGTRGGCSKLEDGLGMIMAEGGIEGVTIKLVSCIFLSAVSRLISI